MTAITANITSGAATNGSNMSVVYHTLKTPMDQAQHVYSLSGRGKTSITSITGVVPAGRSVEILIGGVQLVFYPAISTDMAWDFNRAVDELAAMPTTASPNLVINFGTTGGATQLLTVAIASQN